MTKQIPLSRLVLVEMRKATDTRAGLWLLLLTLTLAMTGVVVELLSTKGAGESLFHIYGAVGPAVSVLPPLLALLVVTGEWSQRTALSTFSLVPSRDRVVAAKGFAVLALAGIVFATGILFSGIGAAIDGGSLSITFEELGRSALYPLISVLIGFGLGLAVLNSTLGIVAYFAAPTVVALVHELWSGVGKVVAWLDQGIFGELVGETVPGASWAKMATAALLWIALPLAIGLARVRRAEVK
jgi:ABC-2 type transport system permease protein